MTILITYRLPASNMMDHFDGDLGLLAEVLFVRFVKLLFVPPLPMLYSLEQAIEWN